MMTNYKTGIDVTFSGTEGVDWAVERPYHDPLVIDDPVVYIKQGTDISMAYNARAMVIKNSNEGGRTILGTDLVAEGGIIRYMLDRDRQASQKVWADTLSYANTAKLNPAYTAPFALEDLTYDGSTAVVGTTGSNGGSVSSKSAYYYRGILDSVGDEWHVFSYASDSNVYLRPRSPASYDYASDGKIILFVVNPKTPCLSLDATGTGQFYTTRPKAYWTPKICDQTSYIAPGSGGTVTLTLTDINGNNVFYRINGGSFTDAGSNSVTLDDSDFSSGSNTLEYYYAGNAAYTKTRTVVLNPAHPSAGESHGYALFGDAGGVTTAQSRVTRAPYKSTYDSYKTSTNFSGQDQYDTWGHQGYRNNGAGPTGYLQGNSYSLINAMVALFEGDTYTLAGQTDSSMIYAKKMLLENSRTICPLGFELSHSAEIIPSRELHYRGYYDSNPVLKDAFAYDIMVGHFRDDQVTGGITAIENYHVRDCLAGFAFEAMQWSAGMNELNAPLMWGGARMMTAQIIGTIMKEYSTPYFGTSGWGSVQTTYPLCPYKDDELTWKEALFDADQPKTAYPNLRYYTGISDNGVGASLFFEEGEAWGSNTYPLGTWVDKKSYFSTGLMGKFLQAWGNIMLRDYAVTDPRLEIAIENATAGTFIGAKDPYPQTPDSITVIGFLNERWPNAAANQTAYIQGLSSTDNDSDDKAMSEYAIAWYDDTYYGTPVDPEDVTAPTPNPATMVSVARFGDGLRLTATTASDPSTPLIYEFSCVEDGDSTSYDYSSATPVCDITGLTPATTYDCRTRTRDAQGNTTDESSITQQTTAAADTRRHRNPRGRAGISI